MNTKEIMANVTDKEHAVQIMISIKYFLDKYKNPVGKGFSECIKWAFQSNNVAIEGTLTSNVANSLVGAIERKSKISFI